MRGNRPRGRGLGGGRMRCGKAPTLSCFFPTSPNGGAGLTGLAGSQEDASARVSQVTQPGLAQPRHCHVTTHRLPPKFRRGLSPQSFPNVQPSPRYHLSQLLSLPPSLFSLGKCTTNSFLESDSFRILQVTRRCLPALQPRPNFDTLLFLLAATAPVPPPSLLLLRLLPSFL